jgi:hypothetical protein
VATPLTFAAATTIGRRRCGIARRRVVVVAVDLGERR